MVPYNGIRAWFLGLWGPIVEVAMEDRIKNLERKMDEVERLLRGRQHVRPGKRSPPRREHRRVDLEDQWDGGNRRVRGSQISPSLPKIPLLISNMGLAH